MTYDDAWQPASDGHGCSLVPTTSGIKYRFPEKTILHIRKNLRHLSHIRSSRMEPDRSDKDLPCRNLQHEEHRTADQFSAHKKLNGKEITGG